MAGSARTADRWRVRFGPQGADPGSKLRDPSPVPPEGQGGSDARSPRATRSDAGRRTRSRVAASCRCDATGDDNDRLGSACRTGHSRTDQRRTFLLQGRHDAQAPQRRRCGDSSAPLPSVLHMAPGWERRLLAWSRAAPHGQGSLALPEWGSRSMSDAAQTPDRAGRYQRRATGYRAGTRHPRIGEPSLHASCSSAASSPSFRAVPHR